MNNFVPKITLKVKAKKFVQLLTTVRDQWLLNYKDHRSKVPLNNEADFILNVN